MHVQAFRFLDFVLLGQRNLQRLSTPPRAMAPLSHGMCPVCLHPPTCRCSAAAACKGCGTRRGLIRTAQRPGVMVHGAWFNGNQQEKSRHAASRMQFCTYAGAKPELQIPNACLTR